MLAGTPPVPLTAFAAAARAIAAMRSCSAFNCSYCLRTDCLRSFGVPQRRHPTGDQVRRSSFGGVGLGLRAAAAASTSFCASACAFSASSSRSFRLASLTLSWALAASRSVSVLLLPWAMERKVSSRDAKSPGSSESSRTSISEFDTALPGRPHGPSGRCAVPGTRSAARLRDLLLGLRDLRDGLGHLHVGSGLARLRLGQFRLRRGKFLAGAGQLLGGVQPLDRGLDLRIRSRQVVRRRPRRPR